MDLLVIDNIDKLYKNYQILSDAKDNINQVRHEYDGPFLLKWKLKF